TVRVSRVVRHERVEVVVRSFFFSSRRRHTRFSRDWSSDVCSSDLTPKNSSIILLCCGDICHRLGLRQLTQIMSYSYYLLKNNKRSEERRVGKECRSRWSP